MPKENKVSLKINGQKYQHWESVEITSELNSIARTFQVTMTAELPNGIKSLAHFSVGDAVQVFIDDELVLTGYIEQTPVSYDANQMTFSIAGRSKTCDLIDCCPPPTGKKIELNNTLSWGTTTRVPVQGTQVQPAALTARNWNQEATETIIATLAGSYGICFIDEVGAYKTTKNFTITPTDKILDSLKKLTRDLDIVFTDNENGDLVAVKKATNEADKQVLEPLELGKQILKASASFDGSKLYSHYGVLGQDKGSNSQSGKKVTGNSYISKGTQLTSRKRYLYEKAKGQADKATCQKEAEGNEAYYDNQFLKTTYTVQGWRDVSDKLWRINTLVKISDPFLCKDSSVWYLIYKVKFSLTNSGGMITTLDVVPPEGFRIEKDTAQDNAKQSKNINSTKKTSSGVMVNRNNQTNKWMT